MKQMPMVEMAADLVAPVRALMTDDPSEILKYAAEAFERGAGAALVTLVEIRGGAARGIGSQMAVGGDGTFCGFVSGGCTEAAVAAEAVDAIRRGRDRILHLGEGSRFFDIVLPCGGGIALAIHVLRDSRPLRQAVDHLTNRRRATMIYEPSRERLELHSAQHRTGWYDDRFMVGYRPLPKVLLCGRSIELEVATRVAIAAGYDARGLNGEDAKTFTAETIDFDTAVVLLYHDVDLEIPILEAALSREPFYLGALGSSRTHAKRSDRLRAIGFGEDDIARIRAPIGIFAKARDSSALALSVMAEVAAAYDASLVRSSQKF